jgi:Matrixin
MRAPVKTAVRALAAAAAITVGTLPLTAFRLSPTPDGLNNLHWPAGRSVVLQMQVGATVLEELIDGNNRWNDVGTTAATAWNTLADINFVVVPSGSTVFGLGDGVNSAFFSRSHYGEPFGDAIGITRQLYIVDTGELVETDVVFDTARAWNSYRGAQRTLSTGERLYDMRRVAMHEFGHVLGLNHPDTAGQAVTAVMNSTASSIDGIQADDSNGVRALYGPYTATSSRLVAGSTMRANQWLTSVNGRYRLYMQGDSNLVLYDTTNMAALWSTGASAANGQAIFQSDGNFVVYDGDNRPIWFTGTAGNPGAFMVLQDDGNLVLYSAAGAPLWNRLQ